MHGEDLGLRARAMLQLWLERERERVLHSRAALPVDVLPVPAQEPPGREPRAPNSDAAELQRLIEVEAALARLASEEYGGCQACGTPIGLYRLIAIPWTRYCAGCATELAQDGFWKDSFSSHYAG